MAWSGVLTPSIYHNHVLLTYSIGSEAGSYLITYYILGTVLILEGDSQCFNLILYINESVCNSFIIHNFKNIILSTQKEQLLNFKDVF